VSNDAAIAAKRLEIAGRSFTPLLIKELKIPVKA
jgi:hypothetical protein